MIFPPAGTPDGDPSEDPGRFFGTAEGASAENVRRKSNE